MTPPDEHPYWPPGVPLPLSQSTTPISSRTPISRIPTSRTPVSRNTRPVPIFSTPPEVGGEYASGGGSDIEETLKSILSSQKQMQKQMDHLLHRVGTLEESVKESSLSSSTSDERRTARLSSELCVSNVPFFAHLQ